MKYLFTLLTASLLSAGVQAQYTLQKFDVNTGVSNSDPGTFTSFKGKTYFFASDNLYGRELWWTDGTSFGLVADINPGIPGSVSFGNPQLCELGGNLYFTADDGKHGIELFMYNGVDSPSLLADIDTAAGIGSFPQFLTPLNGRLYFVANDETGARVLWIYDPLTHAYYKVPVQNGLSLNITEMIAFNGKLLFTGNMGSSGFELGSYTPGSNFISIEADIAPGPQSSFPQAMIPYKKVVFFTATTPGTGRELFMYDGFNNPTPIDINPGPAGAFFFGNKTNFTIYKDNLYFSALLPGSFEQKLCRYNPYTQAIDSFNRIISANPISNIVVYGSKILFSSDSGTFMQKMYVYNPGDTVANPLTKYAPLPEVFNPEGTTVSYGRVYFNGSNMMTGESELYVLTDSVALGVKNVRFNASVTLYPNPASAEAHLQLDLHEDASLNVMLTDMTGKTVFSTGLKRYTASSHDVMIPVQQLPAGNYVYTITSAAGRLEYSGKLVKQ